MIVRLEVKNLIDAALIKAICDRAAEYNANGFGIVDAVELAKDEFRERMGAN